MSDTKQDHNKPEILSTNPAIELGNRLKNEREKRQLSIGEVAERLKLPAKQIEALELGDYTNLPELVFVRGFLRAYGRLLELNDQEMADYLDRVTPQTRLAPVSSVATQTTEAQPRFQDRKIKKPFPTWIFGVIAVGVIVYAITAWQSKSNAEHQKQDATSIEKTELASTPTTIGTNNVQVVAMASEAIASDSSASAIQVTTASAPTNNIFAMPNVQTASETASSDSNTVAVASNELMIKVGFRSMLTITDKDGKVLISKIVPANSEHRFQGGAPYKVRIGFAKKSIVNYGGQTIHVSEHMVDDKTALFSAGQ